MKCFVELSTGIVYKPDAKPRKEADRLKPWLKLAKWKLQAEEELSKIDGLNLCVLRLAHVYGPYTSKFLSTCLCLARVFQSEETEMKWLWDRDLRVNTVHVEDVARAMWTAAEWYAKTGPKRPHPIFNISDLGNTCEFYVSCANCCPKANLALPPLSARHDRQHTSRNLQNSHDIPRLDRIAFRKAAP